MTLQHGLAAFAFALGAVVLAEMGDKTQLLAMAFASRYRASKVMAGVFAATVLNHALAVAAGNALTRFEGAQGWVQAISSLSFIGFGLWTLRGDRLEEEEVRRAPRFGAVMTVAVAFFAAEMGDKTQLATVAISAKFPDSPAWVLAGTTAGMLVADAIGIVAGVLMSRRIPEKTVKAVSAGVFLLFGLIGSYQAMRDSLGLGTLPSAAATAAIAAAAGAGAFYLLKKAKREEEASAPARRHAAEGGGKPQGRKWMPQNTSGMK